MKTIGTLTLALVLTLGTQAQSFDTTGISARSTLYNSYETWSFGAFNATADTSDPFDFGWGNYDMMTHNIKGDSIYIIKTHLGNYKAISIDNMASGVYTITYSNLDFSDKKTRVLDRADYSAKNFFYFDLENDSVKDLEPATADWDIVFGKYLTFFPGIGGYPVAGILHNRNVTTSQVSFPSSGTPSLGDTATYPFNEAINTIGYDWKDAMAGVVYDTLVYYVKDQNGNINTLNFTEYGGSATGKMKFDVNGTADSVILGPGNDAQLYYSLGNNGVVQTNTDNGWDIALFAQSSFSATPIRINDTRGVELYVFPHGDITYWNTVGINEERKVHALSVYPNPATTEIHLAFESGKAEDIAVSLIDMNGRIVLSETVQTIDGIEEFSINVEDIERGMYIVRMSGADMLATSRIVIR